MALHGIASSAEAANPEDVSKLTPVPPDCQERVAFAPEAEGKITIDGKLDEAVWGKAVAFGGFRLYTNQTYLGPASPKLRVLFDSENLYFGVEIPLRLCSLALKRMQEQPLMDGSGKPQPKTGTYTDRESVELFLQPPGKGRYYQFVASLDGYSYEGAGTDGTWNGIWESAASASSDRWFLEIRIPVRELGMERADGNQEWKINVCANQSSGQKTWSAIGVGFHNPGNFGNLILSDFNTWCEQAPARNAAIRQEILKESEACGVPCADRLSAIEAFSGETVGGGKAPVDWKSVTRTYMRLNYVGYSYRCLDDELGILNLFKCKGKKD